MHLGLHDETLLIIAHAPRQRMAKHENLNGKKALRLIKSPL